MRFATYTSENSEYAGVLSEDLQAVICLNEYYPGLTMIELISSYGWKLHEEIIKIRSEGTKFPLSEVSLEAPLPYPPRGIICIGKNYRDHIKEVAKTIDKSNDIPKYPIYFSKLVDKCVGPGGIIPYHKESEIQLDYESELAVVIGKEGKNIPLDQVNEYIFGYTIVNDISERITQHKHLQWFRGKSFDGSSPMGPWIVTKDEFKTPIELNVQSFVNGELRQNSNTREFIFDIPYIISDFSAGITLRPGDIIATGTPAGVGMGFNPPNYLKPGDEIECRIENIGSLKNTVL